MKKTLALFLTLTLCVGFSHAQKSVTPLPLDSNTPVKGATLAYALPTTALKMTVTVSIVREHKGYYAEFAQSLLGLTHVIQENRTYYRLENVRIEPVDVPDYRHTYLVELSAQQEKDNLLAETAAAKECEKSPLPLSCYTTRSEPVPDFFRNYSELSYTQTEDAFVETKVIDGVVTQVPANRTRTVEKTNSQKAQEAADAISKSRKDQYNLISGEQETPYSAETMGLMLQELRHWENNYLSLFTGVTTEDEAEYTFYVVPDGQRPTPAFVFSAESGVSLEDTASGPDAYSILLRPLFSRGADGPTAEGTAKGAGYRYRNAEPAQVSLLLKGERVHDFGTVRLRQLGEIRTLPAHQDKLDVKQIGFVF